MRHLDLFAGIGGFSRAVEWLGGTTVGFVEWDAWNRRVLAKHWPEARYFGDITTVTDDDLRSLGRIDLITGGYPCQPFSLAGQRRGAEDDRHLWPEMRRVIDTLRPRFVLAENVAGHISMGLDVVLSDLEADGYTAGAVVVPAGAVNALHRRDRVWIMAYRDGADGEARGTDRMGTGAPTRTSACSGRHATATVADTPTRGLRRGSAPGSPGQPARGGEAVAGANSYGVGLKSASQRHDPARESSREDSPIPGPGRLRQTDETPRPVDAGADGLRPGPLRRPAARSPWNDPDLIRAMWADGSWEAELPRVVTDEPERRQKLMAAGNAIVPLVAYEILRVMLQEDAA